MRVVRKPPPQEGDWKQQVCCMNCTAVLEIEGADVQARTFTDHEKGQAFRAEEFSYMCPCCRKPQVLHITLPRAVREDALARMSNTNPWGPWP